ncbi:threonine/homoserine/homoserine lactone efflux protein [Geothermobacter ehrlichii]|uniref:Threonine/homoserine/homoserine lactone efflux protein n=1 Tax=Geothermobacter ehrlichii TaxID=213224 RepID=A0A5D3WKS0_9BACT|nr:LysE family translocator [Geothermobacter ehrlichii]TYO99607.1 threonine/homoserine/homoserine lactone efflux protein [Geothermobacter ehrlichii]
MLDPTRLSFFCAASILLILTPGPDNLTVLTRGITQGRTAALSAAAGFALGNLGHTLFAILGLSALLASSAALYGAVKLAGGVYLVWIGVKLLRSAGTIDTRGNPELARPLLIFNQSVIANLLNPKVAIFFMAFFPQFVSLERGHVAVQMLLLGILFVLLTFLFFGLIGWFAGSLGRWLQQRPRAGRWLDRIAGGVLIGLGVRLAWPGR